MLGFMRRAFVRKPVAMTVLLCFLTTSTSSVAAAVNAQGEVVTGQNAGLEFLGGAQSSPSVEQGTSDLNQASDNTKVFLGDFFQGSSSGGSTSALEALADNPDGLVAAGMTLRTSQNEQGCRVTNFDRVKEQETVTTIRAVWRDAGNIETPASYSGPIRVNFPSLGIAKRQEVIVQQATATTPALVLKYELTPFTVPANQYFAYAPSITGNVSGSFSAIGTPENGFTLVGEFSANGESTIVVKADLFKVERQFIIQGTCTPDPQTACAHDGINLCHPGTSSLQKYFARKDEMGENDVGVVGLDLAKKASNARDPVAEEIGDAAADILDGTSPHVTELFSGCTKAEENETSIVGQTIRILQQCDAYWAPQQQCQKQRTVAATQTGNRIDFRAKETLVPDNGSWRRPSQQENLRATITLRKALGGETIPIFQTFTSSEGMAVAIEWNQAYSPTGTMASGPGKRFWVASITNGSASDGQLISHGSAANGWAATFNLLLGQDYNFRYEEYLVTQDQVTSAGGSSCEFLTNAIQDNQCAAGTLAASCVSPFSTSFINSTIPLAGAGAGIGTLLGDAPGMPTQCLYYSGNPSACLDSTVFNNTLPNVYPPDWLDTCHRVGMAFGMGGVAASDKCERVPDEDQCTYVGQTTGTCYRTKLAYHCTEQKEREVTSAVHVTETCGSPIRCLGTECGNTLGEANADFGQAAAAGDMMETIGQDMICEETGQPPATPYDVCTIRVFTGEHKECTIALLSDAGVAPNCCDDGLNAARGMGMSPTAGALAFEAATRVATSKQFMNFIAASPVKTWVEGAWTSVKAVAQPITSAISSFSQKIGQKVLGDATKEAATQAAAGAGTASFGAAVATSINNFLTENGLDFLADALFEPAAEGAAGVVLDKVIVDAIGGVLNFLNGVMLAYTLTKLAGQLLYGCQDEDYELGMQRAQGNCTATGGYCSKELPDELGGGCEIQSNSFCCYKSPLNRIIAEQMRAQMGGYGDPQNPSCQGFTLEEINAFDWANLDLSEWVELQRQAGITPNSDEEAEEEWGMEADQAELVALGPSFGPDGVVTPVELVDDRLGDKVELYEEARDELSGQTACSYNGGIQWYGAPQEFKDEGQVDVYTIKRFYDVTYTGRWWCGGGSDGDAVYGLQAIIRVDPLTNTLVSGESRYYCDGGFQGSNPNGIISIDYVEEKYWHNAQPIAELPDDIKGKECKPTPAEPGLEPFVSTYQGNTQVATPCELSGGAYHGWVQGSAVVQPTITKRAEVQYQLRRNYVTATPQTVIESNCIDPSAP